MVSTGSICQRASDGQRVVAVAVNGQRVVKYATCRARGSLAAGRAAGGPAAAGPDAAYQDNAARVGTAAGGRWTGVPLLGYPGTSLVLLEHQRGGMPMSAAKNKAVVGRRVEGRHVR